MNHHKFELSPPQRLAVAYARADLRPALALLLAFDARLADVVGGSSEPMIAQMKLAWWYDAIAREKTSRPNGEPMLQALSAIGLPLLDDAMTQLLDAWSVLLAHDDWSRPIIADFAATRSKAVFGTYSTWIESDHDIGQTAETWAVADLQRRFGDRAGVASHTMALPLLNKRALRPLSILALSVNSSSGIRIIWHALTGR